MTTGEALKRFRQEFGLKQKTVAQQVGVLPQVYSRYENDQRPPTVAILMTLAKAYGVTTDYLLGLTDTPRPAPDNAALLNALLDCRDLIQSALDTKVKGH
ncbi:MAG: helix-turn-helix transcriptional regulator [Selenomonadaceae bacterium]|nr:helix-turn-helix transcriptional regulator [Selenomonadaceae bacterium]